jgi:hypothetical protein
LGLFCERLKNKELHFKLLMEETLDFYPFPSPHKKGLPVQYFKVVFCGKFHFAIIQ